MAFKKNATNYFLALYPTAKTSRARINIYCEDGYRLYLLFQEGTLSANSYNDTRKTGVAYAPVERYSDYVDLVRNEKPIRVTFNPDASPPAFVVHAYEPIGEGEIEV